MKTTPNKQKRVRLKEKVSYLLSFNWIDQWYETIMRQEKSIKWLAFGIVMMIYITTQFISPVSWEYAEDVRGKSLTAIYDAEKYVVEGLPKTVDFTLEGKEAIVKSLVKTNTFNAIVDLSQLKAGQHIVAIDYDVIPNQVKVSSHPKNVSVLIKEIETIEKVLQLEYYNQDLKDPLIELGTPTVSQANIQVKGAKDKVEQVVAVKGMIDVSDPKKLEALKIELFAVDKSGNKLDVSLEPQEVEVSIESTIPQKEVAIDLRLEDDLPVGKILTGFKLTPNKVKVYAPSNILDGMNVLMTSLKGSELKESGQYTIQLQVPEGVTKLETQEVLVDIAIEDEITHTFSNIPVKLTGLQSGLKVLSSLKVDVKVKGSKGAIESFDATQLKAFVDVKGLGVGNHKVTVDLESLSESTIEIEKPIKLNLSLGY